MERDNQRLHEFMLKLKVQLTYIYIIFNFIQQRYMDKLPSCNLHHRFMFSNSQYIPPFFLRSTYCIKTTNLQGILRNYHPVRQMYIFFPLTNNFPLDDTRPIMIPHEYIQPINLNINLKLRRKIKSRSFIYYSRSNCPSA